MTAIAYTTIDGHRCCCSGATFWVEDAEGRRIASVLPVGTHVALDVFGPATKQRMVAWWKAMRDE